MSKEKRNKEILKLYEAGMSYEELAEIYKITALAVRDVIRREAFRNDVEMRRKDDELWQVLSHCRKDRKNTIYNSLKKGGINTREELIKAVPRLSNFRNIGEKGVESILMCLYEQEAVKLTNQNPTNAEMKLFKEYNMYLVNKTDTEYTYAPVLLKKEEFKEFPKAIAPLNVNYDKAITFNTLAKNVKANIALTGKSIPIIQERMNELCI